MSDHMDDFLRELQDDLNAVQPSPEFAARVRQQVAAEPKWKWFGVWQVATAASVVAVAAVTVMLWPSQKPAVELPVAIVANSQNTAQTSTVQPTAMPPAASVQVEVAPAAAPRTMRTAAVRTQPVVLREPEVIISLDDRNALLRFIASAQAGRAGNVPARVSLFDEGTGELTVPSLKEIQPIVVEPLPGSSDPRGGGSNER